MRTSSQIETPSRVFSVGVIGAGTIATSCHLPVLNALEQAQLRWVTDIDAKRATAAAKAYSIDYIPENKLEFAPKVDVILIALPYGARQKYYEFCRKRDVSVYVEKPFAKSLGEHEELCKWFPEHRFACGLQRRAFGGATLVKQIVEERLFGEIEGVAFGMGGLGTRGGGYSSDLALAGGGVLFDHAIHGIDLAFYCTQAAHVEVVDVDMVMDQGFDIHTKAHLEVAAKGHPSFQFQLTATSLETVSNTVKFSFEQAEVELDPYGGVGLKVKPKRSGSSYLLSHLLSAPLPATSNQVFGTFWTDFLEAVAKNCTNYTLASQSKVTTSCIDQLYSSAVR